MGVLRLGADPYDVLFEINRGHRGIIIVFDAVHVKRLRQIEAESAKRRKLLAQRDLGIELMKEISAKKMVGAPGPGRPMHRRFLFFALSGQQR